MNIKKSNHVKLYIAIGLGGIIGAISRYGVTILFSEPTLCATLTANLIGCFLLTYLLNNRGIKEKFSPEIKAALTVGVVGSFTSFSRIIIESAELWNTNIIGSLVYLLVTILGGLLFCYLGFQLAQRRAAK